jgi:hypothetical protein
MVQFVGSDAVNKSRTYREITRSRDSEGKIQGQIDVQEE